jgi:hypothetical protein
MGLRNGESDGVLKHELEGVETNPLVVLNMSRS